MPRKPRIYVPKPLQTCGGKNCYESRQIADITAREQEIITPDLRLGSYRCMNCSKWHLTRLKNEEEAI